MTIKEKCIIENVDSKLLQEDNVCTNATTGITKCNGDCFFLYFAAFAGSLAFFGGGISIVWTSPVLPKLLSNDTNINPLGYPITSYDTSLIVGLFAVGTIVTPIFFGKLVDSLGRKNTLLQTAMLNTMSIIILAFATNMLWILIARFITGLCLGGTMITLPIFISEVTEDHNRGKFGCLMALFLPLGQLYGYIMGLFFSVKYFTLTCSIPIIMHTLFLLFFIPETPIHFLHKGKREGAYKALTKYRGNKKPNEIEKDLEKIEYMLEETTKDLDGGIKSLFSHQPTRQGLLIGTGLVMIQLGSGVSILLSFMGPIFEEAHTGLSGNMIAVLFGSVKIIIFFLVAHVVEKVGRKPLMFLSAAFSSIALFFIGFYFFAKEKNFAWYHNVAWLPVVSLLFFVCAYSFGLGPIPLATAGELFASNVRSTAFSTITFFTTIYNALAIAMFPIIVQYIGISSCMWFFSTNCAFGALFVHFIMPETKGKSIQEIQNLLKGNNK